ncbi:CCR4-NOT transcription complex subunit 10-like isoform X1 [Haliotis asinina]|uniref:CCR4-NOT transcription complex subunit 10-like isoform X1 n=1 Tax=Haliotis asinina TaxID=109174 RepID=UPI0035327DF4
MADSKSEDVPEVVESLPSLPTVTEQQRELGCQALREFENQQFGQCVSTLNKLLKERSSDVKVSQNKAVAEFYHSGLRNVEEFRKKLNCFSINPDAFDSLEDMDHAFVYYNQAVILYHLRQYRAALSLLDKLFQCIEPLEELLARKVLLLLVELYLCTFQPEKAMGMLSYMEKTYFNGKHSAGQGTPEKPEKAKDNKDSSENSVEAWRPRISVYKIRCLIMLKSMKMCKRELKSLLNTQTMSTSVIYLKSNFEYLRGNLRKAIRMLGSDPQAQVFTNTGESLPMMYFNNLGCIHFHLRKHHLGAFYLRRAVQENENALKDAAAGGQNRPLHTRGMSRHYELLYNMGIQLLHCGRPQAAFDCLIEAVQVYQVNPRLWLRLAECCIQANRENNDEDRSLEKRLEVIQGSVGSGVHRKLILGCGVSKFKPSSTTPSMPSATLEFASLCLRNALLLLPEDPLLADKATTSSDDHEGRATPEPALMSAPPGNPMKATEIAHLRCSILAASAYTCLCLNDHLMALHHAESLLKQPHLSGAQRYIGHLYVAEAQVQLDKIPDSIGHLNPDLVTDIGTCPPEHKSEQEKADKNDKGEKDLLADSTEAKSSLYPWFPKDLSRAKAVMQYNLAAAHAMRGEYDKAMTHLTESSRNIGTPLPAQMYFLKLYLDLMEGRRKMAQHVIKEHFGHVTPNRI